MIVTGLSIGEAIMLARKRQKLSQEELAEKAGISRNSISMMERRLYNPTVFWLTSVANALGYDLNINLKNKESK